MKLKKQFLILILLSTLCVCTEGCNDCGKTTYLPTKGVGYVFMYDSTGCYPFKGAIVTVTNAYWVGGIHFGKIHLL